eukprot:COSAG06_NODE_53254_length_301_cov_0.752475_2_plen_33_part_01
MAQGLVIVSPASSLQVLRIPALVPPTAALAVCT